MERPSTSILVWSAVLAALFVFSLVDYLRKRRAGTWVPLRERPYPYGPGMRAFSVGVMALTSLAGMVWFVQAIGAEDTDGLLQGAFLAVFGSYVTWSGLVLGREVEPERQAGARWRRPWFAWYFIAQAALLAVAVVVGSALGIAAGNGSWWLALLVPVTLAASYGLVRLGLAMRVEDTRPPRDP